MNTAVSKTQTLAAFAGEPYRIFFPAGVLIGLAGVLHWLFFAVGYLPHYSGPTHSAVLTQAFMGCFIAGFLMTAFPRFTGTAPCRKGELWIVLFSIIACAVFHFAGNERAGRGCHAAWILALLFFTAGRVVVKRKTSAANSPAPPVEMLWIVTAILHALLGWLLFEAGRSGWISSSWMTAGRRLADQGFILCVVTGVGGFLGPRLMGTFRIQQFSGDLKKVQRLRAEKLCLHFLCGMVVLASYYLESEGALSGAYFLRASAVTAVFAATGALAPKPLSSETFVWGVWLSFWLIVAGLWGCVFRPLYRIEWMHLVFLGGYSLMTFSVAAMVILSHAGETAFLRKRLVFLEIVFAGIFISLAVRLAAPFFPDRYLFMLGIASALWSSAAAVWLVKLVPFVFRFVEPSRVEEIHEEAKKRILAKKSGCCESEDRSVCRPIKEDE